MNHDIIDFILPKESDSSLLDPYLNFINNIYDNHLESINRIYRDFKSRFAFTPFFLGNLKNTHLTDFIINLYQLDQTSNTKNTSIIYDFESYYNSELHISYNIIKHFIKQIINLPLEYNTWINFCYECSDLYELHSKNRL